MPKLTMVPSDVHNTEVRQADPVAHIFYEKRVADVHDTLPKHSGFLASQLAFGKYLMAAQLFN